MNKFAFFLCLSVFVITGVSVSLPLSAQQGGGGGGGFNGVDMNMGNLYRLSNAKSRSISPENFSGEKGQAGKATAGTGSNAARELGQGWKLSPSVIIKAKTTFTLAEIEGPGSIQHIWMTPTGNWRYSIIRIYWDDETLLPWKLRWEISFVWAGVNTLPCNPWPWR